jgi:phosphohistidine phosphatase
MSAFCKQEGVSPDLILSSCAHRARETADIMVRSARLRSDLRFDERIYEASVNRLLEVITQIEKSVRSALIVGHNPGLEELLSTLTAQTETMPTAALAKITFKNSNWTDAVKGGALEWVVRPKDWEKACDE